MDLAAYAEDLARRAKAASRALATAKGEQKNQMLLTAARGLEERTSELLAANQRDLDQAALSPAAGERGRGEGNKGEGALSTAGIDRLRLTPERLSAAAQGLRQIAALP